MRRFAFFLVILGVGLFSVQAEGYEIGGGKLAQLQEFSDAFAELAARVKPGVVAVKTEKVVSIAGVADRFRGTPFEDFFGSHPFFRMPSQPHKELQEGLGSGVIVSEEGYILTNNHVITGRDRNGVADKITVELVDRRTFEAKVVGRDPLTDLAVLKIDGGDLPTVPYGDSDALRVGEIVVAVGNPFGQLHTVTSGIVSAVGRSGIGLARYEDFIQTDAAINPGNSGGALVNTRGEVMGINTAIASRSGGYQGIGFAVPINMARKIMAKLIEDGEVRRGFLGILPQDIDKDIASALGLRPYQGVLVGEVVVDKPAEKAGIEVGDVILEVDGEKLESADELRHRIADIEPGTAVKLRVLREGRERAIKVKLGELVQGQVAARSVPQQEEKFGLRVQELTDELARQLKYEGERGVVVVEVRPGSAADRAGLERGDLVQEVNRRPVESVRDFQKAIGETEGKETILLLVRRGEYTQFVALRLPER